MRVEDFRRRLREAGAPTFHEERVLRAWMQVRPLDDGDEKPDRAAPKRLRAELSAFDADLQALVRLRAEHESEDGSARWLLELADGQTIESVLLPRDGLCVSTQVGCAVGCIFCMTGREGLRRQLGSAEIVAQVVLARRRRCVKKVVFMGMGEPAHNLDNVLEAIDALGRYGNVGHKNLVFSTVGDRRVFERLPQGEVKPALALSLHTTRPELRAKLLPRAPNIDPEELVALAEEYARSTGYPVQYQWTLIEGVNDTDEELEGLARLLAGKYAVMNFIPYNAVEGGDFRRPAAERVAAMSLHLYRHGILTKLRQSAGQDVAGACGQLRASATQRPRKSDSVACRNSA